MISHIKDPEHPYSLEQLKVIQPEFIQIEDDGDTCYINLQFTPTVNSFKILKSFVTQIFQRFHIVI